MALCFVIISAFSLLLADGALADSLGAFTNLSAWLKAHSVTEWFETCVETYGSQPTRGFLTIVSQGFKNSFDVSKDLCQLIIANTPMRGDTVYGVGRYIALNEFAGDAAFYASASIVLFYIVIAAAHRVFGQREVARPMFLVGTISMLFVVATAILLEVSISPHA